ncbi:hypothetical protein [Kaarinaea lacus]
MILVTSSSGKSVACTAIVNRGGIHAAAHIVIMLLMVITGFVLVACDIRNPETTATPNASSDDTTTVAASFIAPVDGQLTEQQLLQYLSVKQSEKDLLSNLPTKDQNKPLSSAVTRYQDIERQAAQLNKLTLIEYEWIKNTVINSRIKHQFMEYFALNNQIIALLENTLQRHEATKATLKNPEEIAILDGHVTEVKEHIETLKSQIEKYTDLTESDRHNVELVKKFEPQLRALEK